MKLDAMTSPLALHEMGPTASSLKARGFDGLVITETGRSAFMAAAVVALAAPRWDISTGVAVAFSRSPMVTAANAWELAEATGGRFRLGLGTQVKAHITRRYSAEFDRPGPRMAEYVRAMRAIFAAFRGDERLSFEGEFWNFSLLPPAWSPGPIDCADPAIDVAAVNPWMLRMAGELADGVHVHPLNTDTYVRQTLLPQIEAGAARSGRSRANLTFFVPCFTVVGDDEREREKWRGLARMQVAFYGSTPNYAFLFEQLGAAGVGERLNQLMRDGNLEAMGEVLTDELLAHFVVESSWDELAPALLARYGSFADRLVLYFANPALADQDTLDRFGDVARRLVTLSGGSQ